MDYVESVDSAVCGKHAVSYFGASFGRIKSLSVYRSRARNWNLAGMRIRPPRSPESSASGASKWAGVDDGRLPSLSQMQMFMAATILEGGCQGASG